MTDIQHEEKERVGPLHAALAPHGQIRPQLTRGAVGLPRSEPSALGFLSLYRSTLECAGVRLLARARARAWNACSSRGVVVVLWWLSGRGSASHTHTRTGTHTHTHTHTHTT